MIASEHPRGHRRGEQLDEPARATLNPGDVMPLADDPRFAVKVETRGSIAVAAIIPKHFDEAPLFAYRAGNHGDPVRFPGLPTRAGLCLGSAGALGIEELALALERAAAELRATVSRREGQTP